MSSLGRKLKRLVGGSGPSVPEGYTAIDQFDPRDVFIVGYPKSGNTWFQNLAAGLVYGLNPKMTPPALVNDAVPDVNYNQFYRRYSTPMFYKSHALPCPAYRRVVYLLRDGRDAMVSYFHYLEALEKKPLDFLELVTTGHPMIACHWHEHVQAWEKNPHGAEVLTVRYETLLEHTVDELERFCRFINLPRERPFLESVAESASFKNLRQREDDRVGGDWHKFWPAEKKFFRRGVAGSHRDEMPPAVREAFMACAGPTLSRLGYS